MRKPFLFLVAVSFLSFASCQSTEDRTDHQEATHHQADLQEPLEKNQGERWVVNEEMKPYVERGETAVKNYIDESGTEYKALAQQLKEENNGLIAACTMEGKSHDELHKWLHPHMQMVEDLGNAKDEEEAMKRVHEIHFSYQTYHEYFQ